MKKNERRMEYFKAIEPKEAYELDGTGKSENEVLDLINRSYRKALEMGYDNKDRRWSIVCVRVSVVTDENDEFLSQEVSQFVTATACFNAEENAFVVVRK